MLYNNIVLTTRVNFSKSENLAKNTEQDYVNVFTILLVIKSQ